ncbi:MAG: GNAT family N-acetyltransferase [Planctomycetota bacterium]
MPESNGHRGQAGPSHTAGECAAVPPTASGPGTTSPDQIDLIGDWHAGPVADGQERTAVSLVLTGRLHTPGEAVREFESYLHRQGMSRRELWGLWERPAPRGSEAEPRLGDGGYDQAGLPPWAASEQLRAAVMGLPQPGKTAMLFLSPSVGGWAGGGRAGVERVGALVRSVSDRLLAESVGGAGAQALEGIEADGGPIRIVQALLDPGQVLEQEALGVAGFSRLAKLVYMARTLEPDRRAQQLDLSGLQAENEAGSSGWRELGYSPLTHAAFASGVLASYEDTQDCPGLLGLRTIEDVLAGHRATGRFDPSLWRVLMWGDQPAAVMLLAAVGQLGSDATDAGSGATRPPAETYELVYLGVAKPFRGQGLAGRLLRHGMAVVEARGGRRLLLAVDDRNEPAVSLYRALGFRATARKLAMIRHL